MTYTMRIEFESPGGNEIRRMKSWKYAALRDEVKKLALAYFMEHGRPVVRGKAHITFSRSYARVEQDYDNLVFTGKPWFDVLKTLGVIVDDSPKWVDREYKQEQSKDHFVEIEIKRAPE